MKKIKWLTIVIALLMCVTVFVACTPPEPEPKVEFNVKFVDGETTLKTVKVEKGKNVESYVPVKTGLEFVNWFATPSKTLKFDFSKPITKDISIYAGFSTFKADVRDFYILGSGVGELLRTSNWGKSTTEAHKLAKAEGKNEYSITLDLFADDQFQFAKTATWENKRGFGYLTADKLADKTVCFSADGGLGDPTTKDKNIRVDKDGNYTFTLRTFPGDDMYRTDAASYTEATKEMHNYSPYDQISWKRNGDPIDVVKVVTDYYIKGKDITDWKDFYGPDAMMENKEGVYKMSVYLKKGDQFMFTSLNTIAGTSAVGSLYIKYPNLDDASKELFKAVGENIEVKEAGLYSFVFDSATKKLSAKVDKTATVALRDYYLDGTFAGEWGDTMYGKTADRVVGDLGGRSFKFLEPCAYKLIETEAGSGIYTISNIVLAKDSQVIIQTYKAGSKEPGNWGAEGYNALGTYNYKYLFEGGDSFSAVDTGNQNIKVLKAGTYNITFNSYSKMFKIEKAILERDVYIKGTMNSWNHNFDAANKFTLVAGSEVEYEMTKTFAVKDEFGLAVYVLGGTTGMGDFLAKGALGDAAGNVNAKFIDAAKGNLIASEAGSFRIVYNRETKKINIFAVV